MTNIADEYHGFAHVSWRETVTLNVAVPRGSWTLTWWVVWFNEHPRKLSVPTDRLVDVDTNRSDSRLSRYLTEE